MTSTHPKNCTLVASITLVPSVNCALSKAALSFFCLFWNYYRGIPLGCFSFQWCGRGSFLYPPSLYHVQFYIPLSYHLLVILFINLFGCPFLHLFCLCYILFEMGQPEPWTSFDWVIVFRAWILSVLTVLLLNVILCFWCSTSYCILLYVLCILMILLPPMGARYTGYKFK